MSIISSKGTISSERDEIAHTEWPCVPLPQHYDIDGKLLPCKDAVRQRAIRKGFVLKGSHAK